MANLPPASASSKIAAQVFPLTGFYQLLLENPQTPSEHHAYYPPSLEVQQVAKRITTQQQQEERARLVFGSRLVGPRRREKLEEGEIVAGIRVPPKPVEPDNCCMSGCVNCVWDLFREELEEWAAANAQAQKGLTEAEPKVSNVRLGSIKTSKASTNSSGLESSGTIDGDSGKVAIDKIMWKGLEDIPVGIRVFMETEKAIKSRKGI